MSDEIVKIPVNIDFFGKGSNLDNLAYKALQWAKKNVSNIPIVCQAVNKREVHFSNNKIRHSIENVRNNHSSEFTKEFIALIQVLPELIKTAEYRYGEEDKDGRDEILKVIMLKGQVIINGKEKAVEIILRDTVIIGEDENRLIFYQHSFTEA